MHAHGIPVTKTSRAWLSGFGPELHGEQCPDTGYPTSPGPPILPGLRESVYLYELWSSIKIVSTTGRLLGRPTNLRLLNPIQATITCEQIIEHLAAAVGVSCPLCLTLPAGSVPSVFLSLLSRDGAIQFSQNAPSMAV